MNKVRLNDFQVRAAKPRTSVFTLWDDKQHGSGYACSQRAANRSMRSIRAKGGRVGCGSVTPAI
jgi:hypothetical protein